MPAPRRQGCPPRRPPGRLTPVSALTRTLDSRGPCCAREDSPSVVRGHPERLSPVASAPPAFRCYWASWAAILPGTPLLLGDSCPDPARNIPSSSLSLLEPTGAHLGPSASPPPSTRQLSPQVFPGALWSRVGPGELVLSLDVPRCVPPWGRELLADCPPALLPAGGSASPVSSHPHFGRTVAVRLGQ